MVCKNCGAQVDDKAIICVNCGQPIKKPKKPITKKWWFWVLIAFAALFLIVVASGPSSDDPSVSDPMKISPTDLIEAYQQNEVAADEKYKDKTVEISGSIKSIGTDVLGDVYITLDCGELFQSIQCYFKSGAETDKVNFLVKGQNITIVGKCKGLSITNILIKDCKITSDITNQNPPEDPTNQTGNNPTAGNNDVIEIAAEDLFAEYNDNSVAADSKYKNKKLKITGTVNDIGKDISESTYITLDTGEMFYSIQCYFTDSELEDVANLKKGDTVTLIGTCDGMMINVIVKRCEIQK